MVEATGDLVEWLGYFRALSSGCADELIEGTQASLVEATAYVTLGLARAALGAIRREIELLLAYTYFRDHPVEWEQVKLTGEGFMLLSAIQKYHREVNGSVASRLDIINRGVPSYKLNDIYGILSAHIHGQSPYSVPRPGILSSVVFSENVLTEVVEMQREVAKAISRYLVAVYAENWPDLPSRIVTEVARQVPQNMRARFFDSPLN